MRTVLTTLILLLFLCCTGSILAQQPFTYQGMLKSSGVPAEGPHDFEFSLWTAAEGGSQVGSTIALTEVRVVNGLFQAELDFGNVWDGNDRYLQIAVRASGGSDPYTTFSPRLKVSRVPYSNVAFTALKAPWANITGMPAGFADGVDNDTTYTAGAGLQLSDNTFSIANGGIVSAMLADGAVTGAKLASGAVTTAKIGDAQVTDAKIASVSWSKVTGAPNSLPPSGSAGGDLSGTYPNPTVAKIQGRTVSSLAPSPGQVLKWDGSMWSPQADTSDLLWQQLGPDIAYVAGKVGIGTTSPAGALDVQASTGEQAIRAVHTAREGVAIGVLGQVESTSGAGVKGSSTATSGFSFGVLGETTSSQGSGVLGHATSADGAGAGVFGVSAGTSGAGVIGHAYAGTGETAGVYGRSDSTLGRGVVGHASASSGVTRGVYGQSDSSSGMGVLGLTTATSGWAVGVCGTTVSSGGVGVLGLSNATSGATTAVWGETASTGGTGVVGFATASTGDTSGVWAQSNSTSGRGLTGYASAPTGGTCGVVGVSESTSGTGVRGVATATSGWTVGVSGQTASTGGIGVLGLANATTGFVTAVWGETPCTGGRGVVGFATASTGDTSGVWAQSNSTSGRGLTGYASALTGVTYGVVGVSESTSGTGVRGVATATSGVTFGVYGQSDSSQGYGVFSAGRFAASGTKSFQIDHPLSPETAYLNHYSTEGPEPYNAYSGNTVTDAQGYATVQLPDYFESVNRDYRYQLTVIDGSDDFVLAKVVHKIQNNRFVIRTSKPFVEVSWRVEAVRNDRWVREYGYQAEQPKAAEQQGRYLHPELYGQPKELGIHYRVEPKPETTPVSPAER